MKNTEQIQKEVVKKVKGYLLENKRLLNKYGLKSMPVVSFPQRKKVPALSSFGLWLVKVQGGVLDMRFSQEQKQ